MKLTLITLILSISLGAFATDISEFPESPDERVTNGSLCSSPIEYRYPEHIAYCGREVSGEKKAEIFQIYRRLGYVLPSARRSDYKIDHYIPLCMGGSNQKNNLWPQHQSLYQKTDTLEGSICEKMREGKISQSHAVRMIKEVKNDLSLLDQAFLTLSRL